MSIEPTDEDLMLRYGAGDLSAFELLYQRHRRGLYQFIAWRSPRQDWVDEIFQDSWANLHRARGNYQPQASFKTFLYQIARNRLIDLLRQKQAVSFGDLGETEDEGDQIDALALPDHDTQSPQDALETRQQVDRLHAAIRTLPLDQREALVLQQFNGMSLDEIAVLTGVSTETVKSRLRYAMNKLRRQLVEQAASEPA